jgi:hypothetical protein
MADTTAGELGSAIRNSSGPQIWQISVELGKQEMFSYEKLRSRPDFVSLFLRSCFPN